MKITKIDCTHSIQIADNHWKKHTMEAQLEDGDDEIKCSIELSQKVLSIFVITTPSLGQTQESTSIPIIQVQRNHEQIRIDNAIADIHVCKTLAELETFKYQRLHSPKINESYNEMLNKLSK